VLLKILWIVIQGVWLLFFAPLVAGVMNKFKAILQGRNGPRILQPYYDLMKYFRKDALFSIHTSWITRATPYILFVIVFVGGLLIPLISDGIALSGDLLLFVYLLAMGRFFAALAALDSGSNFGGMGASRELAINTVIEPAFLLAVLAIIISTGSTTFSTILAMVESEQFLFSLSYFLAMFAMFLVVLGEAGKIPIDNADTHLELTMMHDGMNLEYSGRYYGLMKLSGQMKQLLFMSVFVLVFFPFEFFEPTNVVHKLYNIGIFSGKILILGLILSFVEMIYAKIRLYKIPRLYVTSMTLSLLAIIVNVLF